MIEVVDRSTADGVRFALSMPGDPDAEFVVRSSTLALEPTGDAALVAALPLALFLGEDLAIDLPVSERLLGALPEIQEILRVWWRRPAPVHVDAEPASAPTRGSGTHAGLATSTVQSVHLEVASDRPDRMIEVVRRSDDRTAPPGEAAVLETDLQVLGDRVGLDWSWQYAGIAAVAAAHCAADVERFDLAAPFSVHYLFPWSSHPFVDPLLSSDRLSVVHRHGDLDWFQRLTVIADRPTALDSVARCSAGADSNCCHRCVLLDAGLMMLGAGPPIETDRLSQLDLRHYTALADAAVLLRYADRTVHAAAVSALEAAIRRLTPADVTWPDNWMAHLADLGADHR